MIPTFKTSSLAVSVVDEQAANETSIVAIISRAKNFLNPLFIFFSFFLFNSRL
jgi:hypothetical protein